MWNKRLIYTRDNAALLTLICQIILIVAKGGGVFVESWFWALLPLVVFLSALAVLTIVDILYDKISGFFGDGREV